MTDLNKMWDALSRYQPYADADGHGETWRVMCSERTREAATAATAAAAAEAVAIAADAAAWAAEVSADAADAQRWSAHAIKRIEAAIKERTMTDLNKAERQPLSIDQISMIFNRVYPAQPLSQNIINLVQEVEKHHGIR